MFASTSELMAAKKLVDDYKAEREPEGTTIDAVWRAKKLVDSAFHPQTGELMFFMGRMSFQVPGNMVIGGCMMTFYSDVLSLFFPKLTFSTHFW